MDVLKLIDELEDLIEDSSTVPFSNKVMVHSEDILEIIKDIRIILPDEMKHASWIKEEKDRIIKEAEKEAAEVRGNTEKKVLEMIDEHKITKEAREKSIEIIQKAEEEAKEIRKGALEYADAILEDTQEQMVSIIELINKNREELRE